MRDDLAFAVWSRERQLRIEHVLDRSLASSDAVATPLLEAMRYATLGGGKRMRALLAYAAGELTDADTERVDAAAAAVELIHAYSLVHDDLPCMDDDDLRRGKPTCHVAHGEALALLAGDALQTHAFEMLAQSALPDVGAACLELARASGASGMAGGQAVDLAASAVGIADVEAMHRMKTGALIRAAVRLGALCGEPLEIAQQRALDRYAAAIGLAFQVVDDVLDVEGCAATLGKTAGKDAAQNKPTYVALLGLDEAKRYAERLRQDAHEALAPLRPRGRRLSELSDWITMRTH